MTLPIARDLSSVGVRVNTIAPGLIDTPIYGGGARRSVQGAPGQVCTVPEATGQWRGTGFAVMECITNPYMNAEVIRLDGGIRMPPKVMYRGGARITSLVSRFDPELTWKSWSAIVIFACGFLAFVAGVGVSERPG